MSHSLASLQLADGAVILVKYAVFMVYYTYNLRQMIIYICKYTWLKWQEKDADDVGKTNKNQQYYSYVSLLRHVSSLPWVKTMGIKDLVHTNTFSFENASFLSVLPFRPYWDGIYVKEALTRSFLKTLSKVYKFENAIFYIVVWTVKTEAFKNDDACLVMWHILYQ